MGKHRHPWLWALGALVVLGGAIYLWRRPTTPSVDLAALTVPVRQADVTLRIPASGTVTPVHTVNLSPKTAGLLSALYVDQGDRVYRGEVLARMESQDIYPQLLQFQGVLRQAQANLLQLEHGNRPQDIAQARAQVNQARAKLQAARAQFRLDQERLNRNALLASQGAISRDTLDGFRTSAQASQADLALDQAALHQAQEQLSLMLAGTRPEQIAQAQAQVLQAEGQLEAVKVQLSDTLLRAPFNGIVTQRYAEPGDFVTPTTSASSTASATSTSVVALAEGLEVLAKVPEVDISEVHTGQLVDIVADAYPELVFRGRVRLVAPEAVVDQNVTSFQVRVSLLTGSQKLLSGMNVNLYFHGQHLRQALLVPTVTITTRGGQTGVLVPGAQNQPRFQPITTGPSVKDQTQVLQGLGPGERVFIQLPPGETLKDILKEP